MKTLAQYKWTKEGNLGNYYALSLFSLGRGTSVAGEVAPPNVVAKAVEFMYAHRVKRLIVDDYTIVLDN